MTPAAVETIGPAQTSVLVGENDAATGGQSRFAQTSGVLYGVVRTSGRLHYEIAPVGGEAYVIREIDQTSYPQEHEVMVPEASLPRSADTAKAGTAADSGSITSRNSSTDPGQPCVSTSGRAAGLAERMYRKWMSSPSIVAR